MNQVAEDRYGNGLFDYQKDLFWRMEKNEYNIVLKSRQLGISDFISGYGLDKAIQGEVSIIVSPSLRQSGNIIYYADKWLNKYKEYFYGLDNYITSQNRSEITFKSGGSLISLPNSESTSRGIAADNIIFDEFAFFLHGSDEKIWESLLPSITTKKKKRVIIISTANGEGNLFYHMYKDKRRFPDFKRVFYHWTERAGIDVKTIKRNMDEYSWLQEYEGQFIGDIGSYFPYGQLRECINTELEYMSIEDLKKLDTPLYCGVDIGKRVDFTAITIVTPVDGKLRVVYKKVLKTEEEKEWRNQYALLGQILETGKINRMYIDSAGIGEQIADEFSKTRTEVIKFTFSNDNKAKMFPSFKKKLEEQFIEYPADNELINTLHMIERNQQGNLVSYGSDKRTDEYGHQDLAISLVLACHCYDNESAGWVNPIANTKTITHKIDRYSMLNRLKL